MDGRDGGSENPVRKGTHMALQIAPFIAIGATTPVVVGGAAGATTLTFGVGTTGLPLTAARIFHNGTAGAGPVFCQFISSNNTTTVGVTNAIPVPVGSTAGAVVLGTGGQPCVAFNIGSTFTVTVFVTGGIGYGSS